MSISDDLEKSWQRRREIESAPLEMAEALNEIRGLLVEIRDALQVKPSKPILLGMYRPPWYRILSLPEMLQHGSVFWPCPGCGDSIGAYHPARTKQDTVREHWQLGHFDEPRVFRGHGRGGSGVIAPLVCV